MNKVDYERLMNSEEFTRLYNHICSSNIRFKDLPEAEKKIALAMVMMNDEHLISGMQETMYVRKVPSFEEVLKDRRYLGGTGDTMYGYWRKELGELFNPANSYYEGVFGGAIGIGKTSMARTSLIYNKIRLTALREPQLTLRQSPETILSTMLMSVNLDKGWWTLGQPMYETLRQSQMFEEVKKLDELDDYDDSVIIPFCKDSGVIRFKRGIIIQIGSTDTHALGMTLVGALLDETEFRGGGVESTLDTYTQLKERIRSRMMDQETSIVPKFNFLAMVSSSKHQNGVIYNYTKEIKLDDPHTRIMGAPIWSVKDQDCYKRGYFYVMRGTMTHPSRIMDEYYDQIEDNSYELPPNCKIIKVPNVYRTDFSRIEKALQNLAGEQTVSDDKPFDDLTNMEHPDLLPEFNMVLPLGGRVPAFDKLPVELFSSTPAGPRLARYPLARRYVHLDLAETTEAGIAMVHKELGPNNEIYFVADFVMWVTSPTRIDLDSIENLLIDLKDKAEVEFEIISADQYQSSSMRQIFTVKKVAKNINYVSVDRDIQPYLNLASIASAGYLKTGNAPKLKSQLDAMYISNNKIGTRIRKDMGDALCGSVHNARSSVKDVPTYYFHDWQKVPVHTIGEDEESLV
jgi:hypothetical protein